MQINKETKDQFTRLLGKEVAEKIPKLNISLEQLAARADVDRKTIWKIRKNKDTQILKDTVRVDKILALRKTLGMKTLVTLDKDSKVLDINDPSTLEYIKAKVYKEIKAIPLGTRRQVSEDIGLHKDRLSYYTYRPEEEISTLDAIQIYSKLVSNVTYKQNETYN